ncbi:WW domain-containing oxidoreductase [Fusarium sp. LHS14.1]|nr:WW domain-containing oxidoreductase [Fusarium sp. LHS14.1]
MVDRYAAIHQAPNGPGDSRPVAHQIIQDESLEGKFGDKYILITGCSAGIGIETAKALFSTGATLFLTARNIDKACVALGEIAQSSRVHILDIDLESLESVRSCANKVKARTERLNILICNAGLSTPKSGKTREGFEIHFGVNHLAHFLLFQHLKPLLKAAVEPGFASRVVILFSIAHRFFPFDFKDIERQDFHGMPAYAASKTANLWTANEIERRFGREGIHAWSVQPGAVITELNRNMPEEDRQEELSNPLMKNIFNNASQGAATTVWGAVAAALEGQGGGYLENLQISREFDPSNGPTSDGYGSQAMDERMAEEMWVKSLVWVGLDKE